MCVYLNPDRVPPGPSPGGLGSPIWVSEISSGDWFSLFTLPLFLPLVAFPPYCHPYLALTRITTTRPPSFFCSDWRFHPINKSWSHQAYWFDHHVSQSSLELGTPAMYMSGMGEKLMLWPPNAWKTGGRQKMLPHEKTASDARVLAEFLRSGLHNDLGLGNSDGTSDYQRKQFCGLCGCPGHNRWTPVTLFYFIVLNS